MKVPKVQEQTMETLQTQDKVDNNMSYGMNCYLYFLIGNSCS